MRIELSLNDNFLQTGMRKLSPAVGWHLETSVGGREAVVSASF